MDIKTLIEDANVLRKSGKILEADTLYDKLLDSYPNNAEVIYCKGLNNWKNNPSLAINLFKKSVLLNDKLISAFTNISNLANETGLHLEALKAFDELKKVYTSNLDLIYYRAVQLGNTGEYIDALLDFYLVIDKANFKEDQFLSHQISDDIAFCKNEIRNATLHLEIPEIKYNPKISPKEYHYPLPAKQFGDENYILEFGKMMGMNLKEVIKIQPDYIYWCIENLDNFCVGEEVLSLLKRKGISNKSAYYLNMRKLQSLENDKFKLNIDPTLHQ